MSSNWNKYNIGRQKTICGCCGGPWMPILSNPLTSLITRENGYIDQRITVTCPHCKVSCYEWYIIDKNTRLIPRAKL